MVGVADVGMMFGTKPSGVRSPYGTPPFSPENVDWSADLPVMQSPGMALPSAPRVDTPRPGFFDRGGLGINILGGIADAAAVATGGRAAYLPTVMARRQREDELADEQRREAGRLATWRAQEEYKAAHPSSDPTALERNRGYLNSVQAGLGDRYAENFASNGGGAPQMMNVPGVGIVAVPRSPTSSSAPPGPPDAAVSFLRQNPGMAAQFDQKYGQGASSRYLGGAAQTAGSPFPIR